MVPIHGLVTWLQSLGVLPLLTWTTRWWEVLFPVALLLTRQFLWDPEA